jgi:hypothetical protein
MPVTKTVDNTGAFERAIKALLKGQVLVGVPEGSDRAPEKGEKSPPNNATIAYIQEYGAPEANIPARPFLLPGVESVTEAAAATYKRAATAVFSGDLSAADAAHTKVGLIAQTAIKKKILSGSFAPLSERTLQARARRTNPSGKLSKAATSVQAREELASRASGGDASAGNAKPLYDTHSLFNSINYVIRGKGG